MRYCLNENKKEEEVEEEEEEIVLGSCLKHNKKLLGVRLS